MLPKSMIPRSMPHELPVVAERVTNDPLSKNKTGKRIIAVITESMKSNANGEVPLSIR